MDINKKEVGSRIQLIRKELGMTLEEFGRAVDKTLKSNVSKWERGSSLPNNKRLKLIAELGGVSVDYLLTGNNIQTKSYIRHLIEEIFLNKGKLYDEFGHFGKTDESLSLYELYLSVAKTHHFESSPRFKDFYINKIIDDTYTNVIQINAGENRLIISCLYKTLDKMAHARQKNSKTISDEIFRHYEIAFDLVKGEIEEAKKLETGRVPSEFIQYLEKLNNDLEQMAEKNRLFVQNHYVD